MSWAMICFLEFMLLAGIIAVTGWVHRCEAFGLHSKGKRFTTHWDGKTRLVEQCPRCGHLEVLEVVDETAEPFWR